jgi:anti-anti-sigma regulatory factor
VLVRVLRRTRAEGGDLPLAAPHGVVRKILAVTGLIGVFSVYPSLGKPCAARKKPAGWQPATAAAGLR